MEVKDSEDQELEIMVKSINDSFCKFGVTLNELSDIHINLSENKKNKSN